MKIRIFCISAIFLIIFTDCDREAKNVDLPDFKQKLVITSFLTPGDSVSYVTVSSNTRIYGELNESEPPGNLTATISDGESEINLVHAKDGFIFRSDQMPVVEGKIYRLKVVSDRGMTADASSRVPIKRDFEPAIDSLMDIISDPEHGSNPRYLLSVLITDYAGENNYFRIRAKEMVYDRGNYYYPTVFELPGTEYEFFTDSGREGTRFLCNKFYSSIPQSADSVKVVIYLLNTSKDYYDYHLSMINYSGGGTPFTEISPLYSNIMNGLGIFSSYTIDSIPFRLK